MHTRAQPLAECDELARRADSFVGVGIETVCREAAASAVRVHTPGPRVHGCRSIVAMDHFERAAAVADPADSAGSAPSDLPAGAVWAVGTPR